MRALERMVISLQGIFVTLANRLGNQQIICGLVLLPCLVLAWVFPRFGGGVFGAIEQFGARLAERKRLAIVSIATAAILLRVGLLWLVPVPVPITHDEFSYLLAGDTFAHGRLTNPTHPMWVFFDTIHVNQQPMYMSKYPPAQGAVLAVGQLLGNPWFGVVLSVGLMCAAVLWMLQGWLPPRWALLGAVLVFLRLGTFTYWMNSYWGGAVAAIGGALVVGALPRIMRPRERRSPDWDPENSHSGELRSRNAVLLGLGTAILANSRPLEGIIFCLPVMILLVVWLCGSQSPPLRVTLPRLVLPFCSVMLLCGIFIGYYNWRDTGNPFLFPYAVNEQAYLSTPTLFWQKLRPPIHYANQQFEAFYNGWSRQLWLEGRVDGVGQAARHLLTAASKMAYFYLWPELCVPLVAMPWMVRDRKIRFLLIQTSGCFLGFLLVPWFQAHYAAPLLGTLFALLIQAIRHLRLWRHRERPVGIGLTRMVVLSAVILAPFHPHASPVGHPAPVGIEFRAEYEAQLNTTPGEHLVIVRYSPQHNPLQEWVYNRADIDHAKVVWAREIPGIDIRPLLNYFHGRRVWLAEPDTIPPRLIPDPEIAPQ